MSTLVKASPTTSNQRKYNEFNSTTLSTPEKTIYSLYALDEEQKEKMKKDENDLNNNNKNIIFNNNNNKNGICKTINMETTMMNLKDFEDNYKIADIFKPPNNSVTVKLNSININQDGDFNNIDQSYSEFLQSPERNEIRFKSVGNYSLEIKGDDDNNAGPTTSTPDYKTRFVSKEKYKVHRPPDLTIDNNNRVDEKNRNFLSFDVASCSPVKSPYLSSEFSDDSLTELDDTLQTPIYDSPPVKMINYNSYDMRAMKMSSLLQRFGLGHFAFIFLEQEVDVDLFLTLNDKDLEEIGFEKKSDRIIILSVIAECNRRCRLI